MPCGTCCSAFWTKRRLTLGDNRKVDFSRAMIFMTSNLGASEMSAIMSPKLGFNVGQVNAEHDGGSRRR